MNLVLSLAATLLIWTTGINAQLTTDPSGHWEGVISAQFGTMRIEVDITRGASGDLTGTFSVPQRKLNGLPLVTLKTDGHAITFEPGAIGATFKGDIAGDGTSMTGNFENSEGSLPVTLTRNGAARIQAQPRNAEVARELEGTWAGALLADGVEKRLVFTVTNNPDHTATGTIVSVDEGGVTVPVGFTQKGSAVTIDVAVVGSTFAGALNAAATEIAGTYKTSQGAELPLTFRKK